jgi:hypothetical protein
VRLPSFARSINLIARQKQLLAVFVAILALLWLQAPNLSDPFRVDEDFRTFYWMNKFRNPDLFPSDQLRGDQYTFINLFGNRIPVNYDSPGFGVLYYLASFLMEPVFFSKVLPFFLLPVTILYLYNFGYLAKSPAAGSLLAIGFTFVNLASPSSISVVSGLQRSFAIPLVVAQSYYLYRKKFALAMITTVLGAFIYAPIFVLSVVSWGLSIFSGMIQKDKFRMRQVGFSYLLLATTLGLMILSPAVIRRVSNNSAIAVNSNTNENGAVNEIGVLDPIEQNPNYQSEGRFALFEIAPVIGRGGIVDIPLDAVHFLALFIFALIMFFVLGRSAFNLPGAIWNLLWASLILFLASWLAILITNTFLLYLPSRYTRVGIFLFLWIFLALNFQEFVKRSMQVLRNNPRSRVWLLLVIEAVLLGLIFLYPVADTILGKNMRWLLVGLGMLLGGLGILYERNKVRPNRGGQDRRGAFVNHLLIIFLVPGVFLSWGHYARIVNGTSLLNPNHDERELLNFVSTLPSDVLIAGSPCALDNIPLFAGRQILFSCEKIHKDPDTMISALSAYYADQETEVAGFCQAYHVDYLVIAPQNYSKEYINKGGIFFEPYNQRLLHLIAGRNHFTLDNISDDLKVFHNQEYYVVPCSIFISAG